MRQRRQEYAFENCTFSKSAAMDMLNGRQIIQEEESYFAINETHQARWGGAVLVAELHLLLLLRMLLLLLFPL